MKWIEEMKQIKEEIHIWYNTIRNVIKFLKRTYFKL